MPINTCERFTLATTERAEQNTDLLVLQFANVIDNDDGSDNDDGVLI